MIITAIDDYAAAMITVSMLSMNYNHTRISMGWNEINQISIRRILSV